MSAVTTCFLIEDDDEDQEIFMLALQRANASVRCVTASNGAEAIDKLTHSEQVVDIIFLDLNMPLMNGKQFLHELKKRQSLQDIPVVIYTTSSEPADREETLRLGVKDFITKPTYISDLVKILSEYFPKADESKKNMPSS